MAGRRPVLELLRSGRAVERVLVADSVAASAVVNEIRRAARAADVPVRVVPKAELAAVAQGTNHQGIVAVAAAYRYTPLEALVADPGLGLLFLDGVTDPQNLGSLLRSADGAGFGGVVIPLHRAASVTPAVRRVSAGAAEVVRVARVTNLSRALDEAREAGLWIVGLDQGADEPIWSSPLADPPVALVLGSEDRGISKSVRERCDALAAIPHHGRVESLNVAVAGALAMFEVVRRKTTAS